LSDMDSEEERELATMTDRSAQRFLRAEDYGNQQADDGEDDGATVSSRPVARTLFPQAQGAKRRKSVSFEEPEPSAPTSSKATTVHTNDAESAPPPSTMQMSPPSSMEEAPTTFPSSAVTATQQNDGDEDKEDGDDDITEQVMSLLQTQSIDPSVLASVNNLLVVSARRTKGLAKGRDSAREAVKEKKMKIGRLQEKIAALENSERSLNSQITHMKAGLMKMYEANWSHFHFLLLFSFFDSEILAFWSAKGSARQASVSSVFSFDNMVYQFSMQISLMKPGDDFESVFYALKDEIPCSVT
jgi:hypothetical protein